MQSLVTNSVGAVCAAVIVPVYERGLRSMKGLRSGPLVCAMLLCPAGLSRWAGTGKVGGRASTEPQACALPSKTSRQGEHAAGGSSATTWMR